MKYLLIYNMIFIVICFNTLTSKSQLIPWNIRDVLRSQNKRFWPTVPFEPPPCAISKLLVFQQFTWRLVESKFLNLLSFNNRSDSFSDRGSQGGPLDTPDSLALAWGAGIGKDPTKIPLNLIWRMSHTLSTGRKSRWKSTEKEEAGKPWTRKLFRRMWFESCPSELWRNSSDARSAGPNAMWYCALFGWWQNFWRQRRSRVCGENCCWSQGEESTHCQWRPLSHGASPTGFGGFEDVARGTSLPEVLIKSIFMIIKFDS